MIENIMIYRTLNELKQIAKVDGVLKLAIVTTASQNDIKRIIKSELISNDITTVSIADILHKLCLYDLSEVENISSEYDEIYHVPRKLLLIHNSHRPAVFNRDKNQFTIGINLGTRTTPDIDSVEYDFNPKYHIEYGGSDLFIDRINPNIEVLKYGNDICEYSC